MEENREAIQLNEMKDTHNTNKLIDEYRDEEGRINLGAIAQKVLFTKNQNSNLKKILGIGVVGFLVIIGVTLASVMIGVKIMKDTVVDRGVLVTPRNKVPVQTELAIYNIDISLYTDVRTLDGIKRLSVPVYVNHENSTLTIEVLSYLRVPGVKIIFFGTIYSVQVDRHGFKVVQNDPKNNPFDLHNGEEKEMYSISRSITDCNKKRRISSTYNLQLPEEIAEKQSNVILRHMTSDLSTEEMKTFVTGQSFKGYAAENNAASSSPRLNHYGGLIMANVNIVPVLWGNNIACSNTLNAFYNGVVRSSIFTSLLPQYNTATQSFGTGTAVDPIVDSNPPAGNSITDMQVRQELVRLFNSGQVPMPNANNLYMIHFPPDLTISDKSGAKSCQVYCAYHSTFKVTVQGVLTHVMYSIIPDVSTGGCKYGCGASPDTCDNLHSVASHEIVDAVTDPDVGLANSYAPPLSWYDPANGETADYCNAQQQKISTPTGVFTVQKHWSNKANACSVN